MAFRPRRQTGVVPVPTSRARPRVRLTGPGALVSCLPQLIGFDPVESLVLVGLIPGRAGRREVGLTLRVDLDDVVEALDHGPLSPCHPLSLATALVRNRCVAAQVVVVSDRARPPDDTLMLEDLGCSVVAVLDAALAQHRVDVADAVLVRDGRWWSYFCSQATCCPPEGTLVSRADADLLAAELAWAGESSVVLPGRELIVAKVAPDTGVEAMAVAELLRDDDRASLASSDRAQALAAVAELMRRFETPGPAIDAVAWARLLTDLSDIGVRDGALMPWKGAVGARALALWCAATRIAPPGHVAPPATIAALTAHARGDGALAGEAVARALTDDPGYTLARYAAQALGGGIPPTEVRRMLVGATGVLRARGEPVLDAGGSVVQRAARS